MEPQRLMNLLSLQPNVFNYLLGVWKGGQVLHGVEKEGLQGYEDPILLSNCLAFPVVQKDRGFHASLHSKSSSKPT